MLYWYLWTSLKPLIVLIEKNCNITEHMLVKDFEHKVVKSLNGNILKQFDDFKYLGSYISSSKKDFEIRKAQD